MTQSRSVRITVQPFILWMYSEMALASQWKAVELFHDFQQKIVFFKKIIRFNIVKHLIQFWINLIYFRAHKNWHLWTWMEIIFQEQPLVVFFTQKNKLGSLFVPFLNCQKIQVVRNTQVESDCFPLAFYEPDSKVVINEFID